MRLPENTAGSWVAGLGDAAASNLLAGRAFRRHQTEIGHQLPGRLEAAHIANLRHKSDRCQKRHTAHGLIGLDHRRH
jgi:hypothetical protein